MENPLKIAIFNSYVCLPEGKDSAFLSRLSLIAIQRRPGDVRGSADAGLEGSKEFSRFYFSLA